MMKKVIVIGSPGSGKSTFSRKLHKITGLELFYLDMLFHRSDRTTCSQEEFDESLAKIMELDEWIIDGNYARTLPVRLEQCDTIFWLDYQTDLCLESIQKRIGQPRLDMPWIETELDEEFLDFVRNFRTDVLPEMARLIGSVRNKDVYRFTSRPEAAKYLKNLERRLDALDS